MKRFLAAIAAVFAILFFYGGWQATALPRNADEVNSQLNREVLAYEVINGTPLLIAEFGGSVFLDTLKLDHFSMEIPPFPRWQWTGDWERISTAEAAATADISKHFGPRVLFGLINDDSIVEMHVQRDGLVILQIPVAGPAFIVQVDDVRNTDTVVFVDGNGNRVEETRLTDTLKVPSGD